MNSIKFLTQFTAAAFLLGLFSVAAAAQETNTNQLTMSATVQTTIKLNIENNGGVALGGTDDAWTVNLGNVNGLGLGTPTIGVTKAQVTGGYNYSTPIIVTPVFSGFGEAPTATIDVSAGGSDAAIAGDGITTANMVINPQAEPVSATAASNTGINRVVGFYVAQTEAAGAKTGVLTYTLTVTP